MSRVVVWVVGVVIIDSYGRAGITIDNVAVGVEKDGSVGRMGQRCGGGSGFVLIVGD